MSRNFNSGSSEGRLFHFPFERDCTFDENRSFPVDGESPGEIFVAFPPMTDHLIPHYPSGGKYFASLPAAQPFLPAIYMLMQKVSAENWFTAGSHLSDVMRGARGAGRGTRAIPRTFLIGSDT